METSHILAWATVIATGIIWILTKALMDQGDTCAQRDYSTTKRINELEEEVKDLKEQISTLTRGESSP